MYLQWRRLRIRRTGCSFDLAEKTGFPQLSGDPQRLLQPSQQSAPPGSGHPASLSLQQFFCCTKKVCTENLLLDFQYRLLIYSQMFLYCMPLSVNDLNGFDHRLLIFCNRSVIICRFGILADLIYHIHTVCYMSESCIISIQICTVCLNDKEL